MCGRPCASTKPTTTSVPRAAPAMALLEHPVGLADAGRHAEVDAQPAAAAVGASGADAGEHLVAGRADVEGVALRRSVVMCEQPVQVEVELEDVDARLAEEPEQRLLRVAGDDRPDVASAHAARRRDPGDLVLGRRRADVRIEARRRGRDEVHRDRPVAVRRPERGRRLA